MYINGNKHNTMAYAQAKKIKSLQADWKVTKEMVLQVKAHNYDVIMELSLWQLIIWKLKRIFNKIKKQCQTN